MLDEPEEDQWHPTDEDPGRYEDDGETDDTPEPSQWENEEF